ncbi:hypothetical protein ACFVAV_15370 [Nocardia sp. NPDC057663]|uniref:hypothetical protein n=1 Tax=Nocardia sp. NPDC057663 TaxID=3346201 RepID=UPI00366BC167
MRTRPQPRATRYRLIRRTRRYFPPAGASPPRIDQKTGERFAIARNCSTSFGDIACDPVRERDGTDGGAGTIDDLDGGSFALRATQVSQVLPVRDINSQQRFMDELNKASFGGMVGTGGCRRRSWPTPPDSGESPAATM